MDIYTAFYATFGQTQTIINMMMRVKQLSKYGYLFIIFIIQYAALK